MSHDQIHGVCSLQSTREHFLTPLGPMAEFNELLQPLIARVLQHLHATLAAASLDAGRVRKVA